MEEEKMIALGGVIETFAMLLENMLQLQDRSF